MPTSLLKAAMMWILSCIVGLHCLLGKVGAKLRAGAGAFNDKFPAQESLAHYNIIMYPSTGVLLTPNYASDISERIANNMVGVVDASHTISLSLRKCVSQEGERCQEVKLSTTLQEVKMGWFSSFGIFCMGDNGYSVTMTFSLDNSHVLYAFSEMALCQTEVPHVKPSYNARDSTAGLLDDDLDYLVLDLYGPDTRVQVCQCNH